MICAAMRVGSPPKVFAVVVEPVINNVEPTQIRMFVRRPAGLSRLSRSTPITPPSTAARNSFSGIDGSMFIDDQRCRSEYEGRQQPAFGAITAPQNSFAAGSPGRPQ